MTAIMRHFRTVLADEGAARSVSQEAREIVRRAEVTVERYKSENASRQVTPVIERGSQPRKPSTGR